MASITQETDNKWSYSASGWSNPFISVYSGNEKWFDS